jgi:exodeoxyribonuclease-5
LTTLTQDQEIAREKITRFIENPETTSLLLEGGAGVGKTYLLGEILKAIDPYTLRLVAAPTHKAINVLRRKLDGFGVEWCQGFDDYSFNGTDVITGTTAQALGIAPIILEEQDTEIKFGKTGRGILSKVMPKIVIIDEASMLGWRDFKALHETLKKAGCKLIAVGDAGQLPPVKQEAIPFDKFKNISTLRQIVRQAEGSKIISIAWAIREGKGWEHITGAGVRRVKDLRRAFVEAVQAAGVRPEEEREVFIAYRNAQVNEVQDLACRKLYGHGREAFAPGELVLAEANLYREKVLLCANQDELIVDHFREEERDEVLGVPVVLHRRGDRGVFQAHYLSPEDRKDKTHPYNVELASRLALAKKLEEEKRSLRHSDTRYVDVDTRRRRAWRDFFEWRDTTIITFRHPFAITSHKSQGSTYRLVFADVADLGRFSTQALYVAVTRPRDELVLAASMG